MLWCGAFIGIRSNRLQLFWSIPFNRQNFPLIVRWLCSFFLSVLKTDIFVLLWILTNFSLQEKNSCKAAFWANYSCASKPQWRTPVLPVCELLLLLILEKFQPIAEGKEKKEKKKNQKTTRVGFLVMMRESPGKCICNSDFRWFFIEFGSNHSLCSSLLVCLWSEVNSQYYLIRLFLCPSPSSIQSFFVDFFNPSCPTGGSSSFT